MGTVIYGTPALIRVMRSTTGLQAAIRAAVLHDQAVEYKVDGRKLRLGDSETEVPFASLSAFAKFCKRIYCVDGNTPHESADLRSERFFTEEGTLLLDAGHGQLSVSLKPKEVRKEMKCGIHLSEIVAEVGNAVFCQNCLGLKVNRRGRLSFRRLSGNHNADHPDKSAIGVSSKSGVDLT